MNEANTASWPSSWQMACEQKWGGLVPGPVSERQPPMNNLPSFPTCQRVEREAPEGQRKMPRGWSEWEIGIPVALWSQSTLADTPTLDALGPSPSLLHWASTTCPRCCKCRPSPRTAWHGHALCPLPQDGQLTLQSPTLWGSGQGWGLLPETPSYPGAPPPSYPASPVPLPSPGHLKCPSRALLLPT